jgi:hypothetical protein
MAHVPSSGEKRAAHIILMRKLEGRIPSGRGRCCGDDTEMEVKYVMKV